MQLLVGTRIRVNQYGMHVWVLAVVYWWCVGRRCRANNGHGSAITWNPPQNRKTRRYSSFYFGSTKLYCAVQIKCWAARVRRNGHWSFCGNLSPQTIFIAIIIYLYRGTHASNSSLRRWFIYTCISIVRFRGHWRRHLFSIRSEISSNSNVDN